MVLDRINYIPESKSSLFLLKDLVRQRKKDWYKIFYIEWVFDRFHEGHKSFFKYIRRKIETNWGDKIKIVVGVESDRITKRKKWKNRPYDSEIIRLKEVQKQQEVDYAFIKDRDVRYLLEDLKFLGVDYLVIPDEYIPNRIVFKFFKKFILPRLKKNGVKVIFSRHKQYKNFGVDDKYVNLHTSDLLDKWWNKIIVKIRHIIYLTKESILAILNI